MNLDIIPLIERSVHKNKLIDYSMQPDSEARQHFISDSGLPILYICAQQEISSNNCTQYSQYKKSFSKMMVNTLDTLLTRFKVDPDREIL